MDEDEKKMRSDVLLSLQVALLGMVGPNLRGTSVGWDAEAISCVFIFDGEILEEDLEGVSDIEAEIMAAFPNYNVTMNAIRCDFPDKIDGYLKLAWVFRRKE